MESRKFDNIARWLGATESRRTLLGAAVGALTGSLWSSFGGSVAAKCKPSGGTCDKSGDCCQGARCRHGRCRCRKGWAVCGSDKLCRNLSTDPTNCGACGQTCFTGCCFGGECQNPCGDDCCAECFAEADGPTQPPHDGTEACCPAAKVCRRNTGDPTDDLCCWPDEACLDGNCCCDGCLGTVICGGKCCPSDSCCNGKCCGAGQVCARVQPNKPRKCVPADRSCTADDDCFDGEACWGGTCCTSDRQCLAAGPNTAPVCCAVSHYCDPEIPACCLNGSNCNTGKKVRVRV
jgi:hypothetical protein